MAVVFAMAMVFAGVAILASDVDAEEVKPTLVSTETELKVALGNGEDVVFGNDITVTASSGGYNMAGIIVNGCTVDGAGYTLTVTGANTTWDCAIYTTGGTIENLMVSGAFRGIFTSGCNSNIVLDNVTLDGVCYTISSDGSNSDYSIIVKNSTLNGWTSYTRGYKSVSFENCDFGKGNGDYNYAFLRPYSTTTMIGCTFSESFELCTSQMTDGKAVTLENCTYAGSNIDKMFYYAEAKTVAKSGGSFNAVVDGIAYYNYVAHALEENDAVTLTNDTTITEDLTTSGTIDLSTYALTVESGIKFTGNLKSDDNVINLNGLVAGEDGLVIKKGSIVISGSTNGGDITVTEGTVKILESVSVTNVSVAKDATLIIPEGVTITATSINNEGNITLAGTIDGNIVNNGVVEFASEDAEITGTSTGTGKIDTSAVAEEGTISGSFDTSTTFGKNQMITATGDITLVKGTVFVFEGSFIIPEGVTVTIQSGAQLIMYGQAANLENDGTVVIESYVESNVVGTQKGGFVIYGGTATNNGTISLVYEAETPMIALNIWDGVFINDGSIEVSEQSKLRIGGTAEVTNNGNITVDSEAQLQASSKVVNKGTVDVEGLVIGATSFENYGEITLAGKMGGNVTIDTASIDAILNINGIIASDTYTITVTEVALDAALVADKKVVATGLESQIVLTIGDEDSVSGLSIAAVVDKVVDDGTTTYYTILTMSGDVVADDETEEPVGGETYAVGIATAGDVSITGDLILNGIDLSVGGVFTVPGTLTVINDKNNSTGTGTITLLNASKTTVTGTMSTTEKDIIDAFDTNEFNAVAYTVKATTSTPVTYYYTTLANAIASGTDKATVYGEATVEEDLTVPGTMTVEYTAGALIVIDSDATMTLAAGAVVKSAADDSFVVEGTLVIEDVKKSKVKDVNVDSDVKSAGENTAKYTSLVNALNTAVSGDVIKLRDAASITEDVAIKEGVTLQTETFALTVKEGKTLTIDGTLYVNGGSLKVDPKNEGDKDGKIVLNNLIQSDAQIQADANYPAGAYYSVTEKTNTLYCVMPVAKAADIINDVDDATITLDGKLELADVAFTGTADKVATVIVDDEVKFGTITLDLAKIMFTNDKVAGSVSNVIGTVTMNGAAGTDLAIISETEDDVKALIMSGAFTIADDEKENIAVTGDVSISEFTVCCMTVDGNLTVIEDSSITDLLTVNGTVNVANGKELVLEEALVLGTLAAAEETDDAEEGTITVDGLFVGIDEKAVTGASAVVSGNVDLNEITFVAAGATVPESITDIETYTEYYVDGELWVTAYYVDGDYVIGDVEAPIKDAYFQNWVADGEPVDDNEIGSSKKVDAKINYNIYDVTIYAGEGIGTIAIDGVVMMNLMGNIHMMQNLTAGEHEVTYTLKNGYGGTAKLYMDGKEVSSMVLSGVNDDESNVEFTYTLSGATAIVDQPVIVEEDEGMSLTDILLIVLVVLIVIMAIIVALRMMRS